MPSPGACSQPVPGPRRRDSAEATGRESLAGFTLVATVPAQHMFGFESSVLLALHSGAAFDAGRPFYPADVVPCSPPRRRREDW